MSYRDGAITAAIDAQSYRVSGWSSDREHQLVAAIWNTAMVVPTLVDRCRHVAKGAKREHSFSCISAKISILTFAEKCRNVCTARLDVSKSFRFEIGTFSVIVPINWWL